VQSEKYITVNGSNLDNVTLSGEKWNLATLSLVARYLLKWYGLKAVAY